ncbi:MAG: hypothetical protein LC808_45015 [Actinobacteria bacterium]|nr:hypothetical protein [Actinomycetota bacterium]
MMAEVWMSILLDQLITDRSVAGDRRSRQCKLCGAAAVPDTEQTAVDQIRMHLERAHGAVFETGAARTSARLRQALERQGWTPPADGVLDPPSPSPPGPPAVAVTEPPGRG